MWEPKLFHMMFIKTGASAKSKPAFGQVFRKTGTTGEERAMPALFFLLCDRMFFLNRFFFRVATCLSTKG